MTDFLGSNPIIKINGLSQDRLEKVFELVADFPATGYVIDGNRMVLFKYDSHKDMIPFPAKMGPKQCAAIVYQWLQSAEYPKEPDHDGDNDKGWHAYNSGWGRVDGHGYQSFLAIEPMWIMFGK